MRLIMRLPVDLKQAQEWIIRSLTMLSDTPALPGTIAATLLPQQPDGVVRWVVETDTGGVLGSIEVWPGADAVYRLVVRPSRHGQPDPERPAFELLTETAAIHVDRPEDHWDHVPTPPEKEWAAFSEIFMWALKRETHITADIMEPFQKASPTAHLHLVSPPTARRRTKRGLNDDTREKLRALYQLREDALAANRRFPDFTKACAQAGITWDTAKKYIPPRLRQQWRRREHWDFSEYSELSVIRNDDP